MADRHPDLDDQSFEGTCPTCGQTYHEKPSYKINPDTQPKPMWNAFTEFLKAHPGTFVKLRNGTFVRPAFHPAEDEYCSDGFGDDNYRWETNGRSITSRDFDMMEIVNG